MPSSHGELGAGQRRQDLGHGVLAERRVVGIGRVDEGVALVEAPARVDADLLGPGRGRDVQLGAERDLEAGRDDSRVRQPGRTSTARSRLPGSRTARRSQSAAR